MTVTQTLKALRTVAAFAAIVLVGTSSSTRLQAQDDTFRILQGFAIAPVPLNLAGKDANLVGLGSYLVNAIGDCNGCHSSGAPPLGIYPYTTGRNPYFSQPEQIDPAVYLNGGTNFGTVGTATGPLNYAGPNIITRNLTPDYTLQAEGGHTLAEFIQIMRTGIDLDNIHPTCTAAQLAIINSPTVTQAQLPNCIPTGPIVFDANGDAYNNIPNGSLLQIMPWVTFSHMTDHDLEAIYTYLSAIPCIDNTTSTPPAGAPNELTQQCSRTRTPPGAADKTSGTGPRSRRSH